MFPKTRELRNMPVRPRLFIGSLSEETTEQEIRDLFSKYGTLLDCYVNPPKNFAFVRLDSRQGALKAQEELDGHILHGKAIRVRQAPHASRIWVGSLSPTVSNELLMEAFSLFGQVERAVVICDERGRSKGYGFVEFARKSSATLAVKRCEQEYFLITKSMTPVRVEHFQHEEDETGLEAKSLMNYPGIERHLARPPRFAKPGHLEYRFAAKWRALYEEESRAISELKRKLQEKRVQLEKEEQKAVRLEEKRLLEQLEIQREQEALMFMDQQLAQKAFEDYLRAPYSHSSTHSSSVPLQGFSETSGLGTSGLGLSGHGGGLGTTDVRSFSELPPTYRQQAYVSHDVATGPGQPSPFYAQGFQGGILSRDGFAPSELLDSWSEQSGVSPLSLHEFRHHQHHQQHHQQPQIASFSRKSPAPTSFPPAPSTRSKQTRGSVSHSVSHGVSHSVSHSVSHGLNVTIGPPSTGSSFPASLRDGFTKSTQPLGSGTAGKGSRRATQY